MKSTRRLASRTKDVDMPAEYELDWSKARPNPYAVVLAPDVAEPPDLGVGEHAPA